jgi:hypothetical protein
MLERDQAAGPALRPGRATLPAAQRADMLAKSSSAALHRLNRRVEALEEDVLPVHEETKRLVNGALACMS